MSGRCEEICRSAGYTNSEKRNIKEFSELEWIPCSQLVNWLKYQPKCYDKTDDEFGYRDYQWYEEKGFTFDADANTWRNSWYCREISALYNTVRRTETEVKLELDFNNRTGSYIYYSCKETED